MNRHSLCRRHLPGVMSQRLPMALGEARVNGTEQLPRHWTAPAGLAKAAYMGCWRRATEVRPARGLASLRLSASSPAAAAAGVSDRPAAREDGADRRRQEEQQPSFIQSRGGGTPTVVLKRGKARLFKDGQPIVYSGAVDSVAGRPAPTAGDCVMVADGSKNVFGWGVYNPSSMFRVRMMQLEGDAQKHPECCLNLDATVQARLAAAAALRGAMNLPSAETTVYRLCNSEGDHLSGLVVDVLGTAAVVSSSAAWVERMEAQITECLLGLPSIDRVLWRRNLAMLSEEGVLPEASAEGSEDADEEIGGNAEEVVEVRELGVIYSADLGGQKTGFYADQRDNRAAVARLCAGKRVLDLCCYSGGFAIGAALSGAASVTAVDSSARALELGKKNADLNGVSIDFVKGDIKDFMRAAVKEGQQWDVIVLDPPKLAPNRKALRKAANKYRQLNADAMRLLPSEGGLLLTCTCSGAMTQSRGFQEVVKAAALAAKKQINVLRVAGCGMDHPMSPDYPEGNYLTTLLVSVRD
mmetsp:Transcript_35057/g.99375  ORF Transcript_35057/g.99375 Transcript_35057/m.99375 type:complete len:525 (+) Transcript_35057:216-1790(+)